MHWPQNACSKGHKQIKALQGSREARKQGAADEDTDSQVRVSPELRTATVEKKFTYGDARAGAVRKQHPNIHDCQIHA